jgi:hypothetical protein
VFRQFRLRSPLANAGEREAADARASSRATHRALTADGHGESAAVRCAPPPPRGRLPILRPYAKTARPPDDAATARHFWQASFALTIWPSVTRIALEERPGDPRGGGCGDRYHLCQTWPAPVLEPGLTPPPLLPGGCFSAASDS